MSSSLAWRDAIMMNFIFKHREQTFISVQYYNDIPILVTFQIHHIQCTLSCLRYSGLDQWLVLQLNHIVSALCLSPLSHVCRLVLCLHLHDSGRHCGEIHRSLQVNTEKIINLSVLPLPPSKASSLVQLLHIWYLSVKKTVRIF